MQATHIVSTVPPGVSERSVLLWDNVRLTVFSRGDLKGKGKASADILAHAPGTDFLKHVFANQAERLSRDADELFEMLQHEGGDGA